MPALRRELAQSVLTELGEPQIGEGKYYDYLYLEAGNGWNEDHDTHLATLSDRGAIELLFETEQLIVGALDVRFGGEYGTEVLREWSPAIRPSDWTASLLVDDSIPHDRKMLLCQWSHGMIRLAFKEEVQ